MSAIEAGTTLAGELEIAEVLGRGGMGVVYAGKRLGDGAPVAIKVLHEQDDDSCARFHHEVRLTERLRHPNVVNLMGHGEHEGRPYLVLERLDGRSLREELDAGEPIDPLRAARWLRQVALALAAAHGAGIVHRDLKPDNIFLCHRDGGEDHVKVLDFGIARAIGGDSMTRLTQSGVMIGTPQYMAPEQLSGGDVDERTDLFALGMILYEVLTGHAPFAEQELMALAYAIVHRPAPPLPSSLPLDWQHLVERLMSKRPDERPQSAAEVADLLDKLERAPTGPTLAAVALDDTAPAPALRMWHGPIPSVRYAATRSGAHIAYQLFGEGPRDIVYVPGTLSHGELLWEEPKANRLFRRLGANGRVLRFDRRGTGMSDRVGLAATMEERVDDLSAVMDAEGIDRAHIVGWSEGGTWAAVFAALYPERVLSLGLYAALARLTEGPDFPVGTPRAVIEPLMEHAVSVWGTPQTMSGLVYAPSRAEDPAFLRFMQRYERYVGSPGTVREALRFVLELDMRSLMGAVQAPTFVTHRDGDMAVPFALGRDLAERIPGARFFPLEGDCHFPWEGDQEPLLSVFEQLWAEAPAHPPAPTRALRTVGLVDAPHELIAELASGDLTATRTRDGLTRLQAVGPRRLLTVVDAVRPRHDATRAGLATAMLPWHDTHAAHEAARPDEAPGAAAALASAQPGELVVTGAVRALLSGGTMTFEPRDGLFVAPLS